MNTHAESPEPVAHSLKVMSPFDQHLGITKELVSKELVRVRLEVQPWHMQPFGFVHGGVYCTLAETAASIGGIHCSLTGASVGQSNHTDFLHSSRGPELVAEARPEQVGRTVQLWNVAITQSDGRLVAVSRVRLFNIKQRQA